MSRTITKKTKGTAQAIGVALSQGIEGVLFTLILLFIPKLSGGGDQAAFSAAGLGVKELLALILVSVWTIYKYGFNFFGGLFKKLKSRQGASFISAGVFGTALGNLFYILGVIFAGSGYGVVLTALYPVFSMVIVRIVMKEKEPKMVWLGVAIAVLGGFLIILLPILLDGSSFTPIKIVGMIFGLLAAFFWAIEGVFINMGLKAKKTQGFTRHEIIVTRNIATSITTFALILPVLMAAGNTFSFVSKIFNNWQAFLVVLAIAVNIIILRFLHVSAIRNVGPKVTAIIDTNNFIVPAVVAQIFIIFEPLRSTFNDSTIDWWAYFLLIPIAIGVSMVVYFHKEEGEDKPLDFVNWQPTDDAKDGK